MDDTDKLKVLLNDAKLFGIDFEPPNVNLGVHRFEPIMPGDGVFPNWVAPGTPGGRPKRINYGLGAIKGTGKGAIDSIVAVREKGGPFKSFYDFCCRIDRKACNKRVVEALIKAGAFDSLEPDRARLLASVARGYTHAETQEANADQGGLFDFGDTHGSSTAEPDLVDVPGWSIKERLTLEKTAIGYYLSGHLFDQSGDEVRRMVKRRIANVEDAAMNREVVMLAGIVSDLRVINGNRGRVAIFKLDDKSDVIEAVANEELLNLHKELLVDDELLILQGKVQLDRFAGGYRFNVQAVWDLAGARSRFGRYFYLPVGSTLPALQEVVKLWPARQLQTDQGMVPQGLRMQTHHFLQGEHEGAEFRLELGEDSRFWPCDEALARLSQIGSGKVGAKPLPQAQIIYDAG